MAVFAIGLSRCHRHRYPLKKSLLKLHCPYHELLDLDRIQMFPLIAGMVPI